MYNIRRGVNAKEDVLQQVLRAVIDCCSYANEDGTQSITMDMVMSQERIGDNVNMTRCMIARQLSNLGYNNESIACALCRSESTIRDMLKRGDDFRDTRYAYRLAESEADIRIKAIKESIKQSDK